MTRRGVIGLLAGAATLALSGCSSRETLRYKMTVEVETPEGVKIGYAVREVRFSPKSGTFLAEGSATWKLRGEAVAVDVARGQTLFALLSSASGQVDYAGRDVWIMLQKAHEVGLPGPVELWPSPPEGVVNPLNGALPMLVTFQDTENPMSVRKVDPVNLAASFGARVKLKRIMVQIVAQPVTVGIGARLEWLPSLHGDQLPKKNKDALGPPYGLQGLHFSTEFHK